MQLVTTSLDGLKAYEIKDNTAKLIVDSNDLDSNIQIDQGPSPIDPYKITVNPSGGSTFATGQLSL